VCPSRSAFTTIGSDFSEPTPLLGIESRSRSYGVFHFRVHADHTGYLFGEDGRYSSFDLRPTTEPPLILERATGIEPVSVAWRATAPPVIPYSLKVFVLNL
jgi:hypothetical protein